MATRAVLLDIDGVLTVSWRPIPGAVQAFSGLRERGLEVALLTNTTSRTRGWIASRLAGGGFDVHPEDILTAASMADRYLRTHHPSGRCLLLNSGDLADDLPGVDLVLPGDPSTADVDVVLFGGAGPELGYTALNRAFCAVRRGAALVTMNRNLFWATEHGLQLDTGAFLAGFEQACGRRAVDVGKPAPAFFESALQRVAVPAADTLMVGDDVASDVLAAQAVGIRGVLVRTGKYRRDTHEAAAPQPDHVIDSVADLADLLDLLDRPAGGADPSP
jgi:HAD superfamily hydrolase (TIGR01458 family)